MNKEAMNKLKYIVILLLFCSASASAQTVALKTDLLNWATLSMNIEPEVRVGKKSTLALGLSYNPWTFRDNKKWRHFRVQPEYRYWICRPFGGHFLGLHASYTRFNVGGVKAFSNLYTRIDDSRVQGNEWAVGLGYGYHWILNNRWSIEGVIGLGYGLTRYSKYACEVCGSKLGEETRGLFMPTKLALSVIYYIK